MATARRVLLLSQMLRPTKQQQQHHIKRQGFPWGRSGFSFTCIPPSPVTCTSSVQDIMKVHAIRKEDLASISLAAYELSRRLEASGLFLKLVSTPNFHHHPHDITSESQKKVWRKGNDELWIEYIAMRKQKQRIDTMAKKSVKKELLAGLLFLIAQTIGSMRLTFYELSWDVMEPIAFHVGCFYMVFGYAFYLVTAKDPTYRGWFVTRFRSKQKLLLHRNNFDLQRYAQLRRIFYARHSSELSPLHPLL